MVDIRTLDDQASLQDLILRQPLQPFLQSWAWGEFQQSFGRKIWRFGAYDGDLLVGAALVIRHELMLGKTYIYCPRGPVADSPEALRVLFGAIRDLGRREGAMYVKVDPGLYRFPDDIVGLAAEYRRGTTLQPQQTQVLDTEHDPEELLVTMHPKTRYNIRLAEKKGVTVRWAGDAEAMDHFLRLMHQTAERQGIRLHSDHYYQQLFSTLQSQGMAELILGEYAGGVRAAHMIVWCGQTATYLHGGSDHTAKEAMVPYVLQWETMKRSHEKGMSAYDLWGIAPEDTPNHTWAGISRFKRGFGGRLVVYPSSLNAVLQSQWYQAYRLAKRMRGGVDE